MSRGAVGFGLQLTGMACCPLALAFGLAEQGPAQWGLLVLGAVCFYAGWSLRERVAPPSS